MNSITTTNQKNNINDSNYLKRKIFSNYKHINGVTLPEPQEKIHNIIVDSPNSIRTIYINSEDGSSATEQNIIEGQKKTFKKGCTLGNAVYMPMLHGEFVERIRKGFIIVVCGGAADAISVNMLNLNLVAIAAGGEGSIKKIFRLFQERYPKNQIISIYDNDESGKNYAASFKKETKCQPLIVRSNSSQVKDANDLFNENPKELHSQILNTINKSLATPANSFFYIKSFKAKAQKSFPIAIKEMIKTNRLDLLNDALWRWADFTYNDLYLTMNIEDLKGIFKTNIVKNKINTILPDQYLNSIDNIVARAYNSKKNQEARKRIKSLCGLDNNQVGEVSLLPDRKHPDPKALEKAKTTLTAEDVTNYVVKAQPDIRDLDINKILDYRMIVLDWQTGAGKTKHGIKHLLRHLIDEGKTVAIVVNSKSLVDNLYRALSKDATRNSKNEKYYIYHYENVKRDSLSIPDNASFITCTPSLKNKSIQEHLKSIDTIVIDEAVSVLQQFTTDLGNQTEGSKQATREKLYNNFKEWASKKQIILADAYIENSIMEEYKKFANLSDNSKTLLIKRQQHQFRKINIINPKHCSDVSILEAKYVAFIIETILKANSLVQIACESKEHAKDLKAIIESYNIKTLYIDSDNTANSEVMKFYQEPNTEAKKYKVLLHTPALQAGVSLTTEVEAVFAFYKNSAIFPSDVLQMIARARKAKNIYLYLNIKSHQKLTAEQFEKKKESENLVSNNPQVKLSKADAFEVRMKAYNNELKSCSSSILLELLKKGGYNIQFVSSLNDLTVADYTEILNERKGTEKEQILNAKQIDNTRYTKLKNNPTSETTPEVVKHILEKITNTDIRELEEQHQFDFVLNNRIISRQLNNRLAFWFHAYKASAINNRPEEAQSGHLLNLENPNKDYYIDNFQLNKIGFFSTHKQFFDYNTITPEQADLFFQKCLDDEAFKYAANAFKILPDSFLNKKQIEQALKSPQILYKYKLIMEQAFGAKYTRTKLKEDQSINTYKADSKHELFMIALAVNSANIKRAEKHRQGEEFNSIKDHFPKSTSVKESDVIWFASDTKKYNPKKEAKMHKFIKNDVIIRAFNLEKKDIKEAAKHFKDYNTWYEVKGLDYRFKVDCQYNVFFEQLVTCNGTKKAEEAEGSLKLPDGVVVVKCNNKPEVKQLQKYLKMNLDNGFLQKVGTSIYIAFRINIKKRIRTKAAINGLPVFNSGALIPIGKVNPKYKSMLEAITKHKKDFPKLPAEEVSKIQEVTKSERLNPNPILKAVDPHDMLASNEVESFCNNHGVSLSRLGSSLEFSKGYRGAKVNPAITNPKYKGKLCFIVHHNTKQTERGQLENIVIHIENKKEGTEITKNFPLNIKQ